jgi:hypothetical protein
MTDYTKIHDRFEYYEEDCQCIYCLHYGGKKDGCGLADCCCEDIRADAIANGRIKRDRGWNRNWDG